MNYYAVKINYTSFGYEDSFLNIVEATNEDRAKRNALLDFTSIHPLGVCSADCKTEIVGKIALKDLTNLNLLKPFIDNFGISLDFSIVGVSRNFLAVDIELGDWKHEHGYCDQLFQKLGFVKVKEEETYTDGSDCYSSIHYYQLVMKGGLSKRLTW